MKNFCQETENIVENEVDTINVAKFLNKDMTNIYIKLYIFKNVFLFLFILKMAIPRNVCDF